MEEVQEQLDQLLDILQHWGLLCVALLIHDAILQPV